METGTEFADKLMSGLRKIRREEKSQEKSKEKELLEMLFIHKELDLRDTPFAVSVLVDDITRPEEDREGWEEYDGIVFIRLLDSGIEALEAEGRIHSWPRSYEFEISVYRWK